MNDSAANLVGINAKIALTEKRFRMSENGLEK